MNLMFEKFDKIRLLSRESRSSELRFFHTRLHVVLRALSPEDLEELIQICIFGRDHELSEDEAPANEFASYRDDARFIAGAGDPVVYIAGKPIAQYLDSAERKLRGVQLSN